MFLFSSTFQQVQPDAKSTRRRQCVSALTLRAVENNRRESSLGVDYVFKEEPSADKLH